MKNLSAVRFGDLPLPAALVRGLGRRSLLLWLGLAGVSSAQTILTPPQSQSAIAGGSVSFNVSAAPAAPSRYLGGFNYGSIYGSSTNVFDTGQTAGTLIVSFIFGPFNDRMTVYYSSSQIHDTGSLGGPNTRTFTANYGPGTNTAVTVIMNEGTTGTASTWEYQISTLAPLYYQWQFNNTNILGATNATYTLNNVTTNQAGIYRVLVTDNSGPGTNAVATLTVSTPPTITQPPVGFSVVAGGAGSFNVTATGTSPLAYQWRFFGTNLTGATTNRYSLTNIQTANAGDYTVVVTNPYGSSTSTVATLKVVMTPILTGVSGSSTNFSFAFQTVTGSTYVTEAKVSLNLANWTPIATNAGTGSMVSENFAVTSGLSNRFYRVLVR